MSFAGKTVRLTSEQFLAAAQDAWNRMGPVEKALRSVGSPNDCLPSAMMVIILNARLDGCPPEALVEMFRGFVEVVYASIDGSGKPLGEGPTGRGSAPLP